MDDGDVEKHLPHVPTLIILFLCKNVELLPPKKFSKNKIW
jgi:hypothetical protein